LAPFRRVQNLWALQGSAASTLTKGLQVRGVPHTFPGGNDKIMAASERGATALAIFTRRRWQRVLVPLVVAAVAVSLAGLFSAGPAQAIHPDAAPALGSAGQVRIFWGGRMGSGTLVSRNWALIADHGQFRDGDSGYLVFGEINDANDADPAHRRTIGAIVRHPNRADLALVHFADPVPEDTYIPELATAAPPEMAPAHSYGWSGGVLGRLATTILSPDILNAFSILHGRNPKLTEGFTEDVPPMTTNLLLDDGDSGGGTFSPWKVLTGVHVATLTFHVQSHTANQTFTIALEQPVWRYRSWILSVIGAPPPRESPPRESPVAGAAPGRQLLDATAGDTLHMTLPPQTDHCDPGMPSCTVAEPVWLQGVLLGAGNYRGTALARCASADTRSCSFDGAAYGTGASARIPLGPSSAPDTAGTRRVMIWCKTSVAFPDANSPAQQVLRVSFTNADPAESPLGYGWWDVSPGQVGTGAGQTPVDSSPLAAC
jgi:hypothetical protein